MPCHTEPERDIDAIASKVIAAAVEVHKHLGLGFLEAIYEEALGIELFLRKVPFVRQPTIPVTYKGHAVADSRPDLLVSNQLIVELKAVEQLGPLHLAQAVSYLRATGLPLALVINFNVPILLRGVRRVVLSNP
ncbi:MAG: GxxExxY protein [Polyangiaceae bacterium]